MDSGNLVARINLPNSVATRRVGVETHAASVRGPGGDKPRPYGRIAPGRHLDFIDMYAGLNDNERRRYREQYPQEATTMAGIVQRAREESQQQGIEQGERTLLRRLLGRRFGLLPPNAEERIGRASTRDLESWAENVLDAGTLDEVFDSNH